MRLGSAARSVGTDPVLASVQFDAFYLDVDCHDGSWIARHWD
jgi:hypothetical protein